MKFVFLFLGRTQASFLEAGIREYAARLNRMVPCETVILRDRLSRSLPAEQLKKKEAEQLLHGCRNTSYLVALDAGGKSMDSEAFAACIESWERRGLRDIHFVIGGHLGLHQDLLSRADLVLSLSAMTFTHEMARLILLEQVYRGCMIRAGRSYHN